VRTAVGSGHVGWSVARKRSPAAVLECAAGCGLWLTLFCAPLGAGGIIHWPSRETFAPHLYWFDAAMVVTLAAWGGSLWLGGASSIAVGRRWAVGGLAGLCTLALAGVPSSVQPAVALGMAARLWLTLLFYLFLVNYRSSVHLARSAFLCSLCAQALVALSQVARQSSLGLGAMGEPRLNPAARGIAVTVFGGHRWLRAYGLTAHPNLLGGLAVVTGLFLAATVTMRRRWLSVGCVGIVLVCAQSRGAGLAAGAGAICLALIAGWRPPSVRGDAARILGPAAALCIGALAFFARFNLGNRLEVQSIRAHLEEVGQALGLILHHPLLGVGANCYPLALGRVVSLAKYAPYGAPVVHNIFLLAGAELGLVGALILIVLFLGPIVCLHRLQVSQAEVGAAIGLLACAILGLTDFSEWASPGFRVVWISLLAIWAGDPLKLRFERHAHER